jgi:hypothetical protein
MATIINASNSTGLTLTSDLSGTLQFQNNGVNLPMSGVAPAFRAYSSGNQSVTTGTFTKITLNNETFDTNNNFDSTTNYRFTPTVAGYYQINAQVFFSGFAGGYIQLGLFKNGSIYGYGSVALNNTTLGGQVVVSDVIYLNGSTDYVELFGWQNSSATLNTFTSGNYMSGCLVRGA